MPSGVIIFRGVQLFSSLKTERVGKKVYRTRTQAKADVLDYIECFYNPPGITRPWDNSVHRLWTGSWGSSNAPIPVSTKPAAGQGM